MAVEESLRSKKLYKVFILMLKYIPMIISLVYMTNTFLSYFYIDLPILSSFAGMSILSWIFMYIAASVFRFCIYHKMFLYYILVTDMINIVDYYIGIPITDFRLLMFHSVLTGVFLFILLYVYVKNYKKPITKDSR